MSSPYRIKYEPLANAALEEAGAYIQETSGAGRAAAWLRSLLDSVQKLEMLPRAYGVCGTFAAEPLYSKLVPPYRVFYVVRDVPATVHIVDLVHTARETRLSEYRNPTG